MNGWWPETCTMVPTFRCVCLRKMPVRGASRPSKRDETKLGAQRVQGKTIASIPQSRNLQPAGAEKVGAKVKVRAKSLGLLLLLLAPSTTLDTQTWLFVPQSRKMYKSLGDGKEETGAGLNQAGVTN